LQILKTILSIILIAALLLAAAIGIFWEKLLSPEQKLRYGRQFSAVEDYRQLAAANPSSESLLADYVGGLVLEGNIGRASYLSELYGIENEQARVLRSLAVRSLQESAEGRVLDITAEPEAQQFMDTPAWEVLRYLEGYRHALSGDWMSARNEFMAIRNGELPEVLRGWHSYYLARAYRYGGTDEEQAQVEKILLELLEQDARQHPEGSLLAERTTYNLIDWYLAEDYPGKDGAKSAGALEADVAAMQDAWSRQKTWSAVGEYMLLHADPGGAWSRAREALLVDPTSAAGKSSGDLALRSMLAVLDRFANRGSEREADWQPDEEPYRPLMNSAGELQLELPAGVFRALAQWAAASEREAETARLLVRLRAHVSERRLWEELRVGEAICYRSAKDGKAMQDLLVDANLRSMSDEALSDIYFENGMLLRGQNNWNEALRQLRSSAELNGPRAGEAWFQAYLVLKRVQDPLNEAQAIEFLQHVLEGPADNAVFPRAFEEVVPLLIHTSSRTAARQLCERVLGLAEGSEPGMGAERASELATVARFWLAWIAEQEGKGAVAAQFREGIELRHWNYYEVTGRSGIEPQTLAVPGVLALRESAGEYFAGMGLTSNAEESFLAEGLPDSQLLAWCRIANAEPLMSLPSVQWRATEVLESGVVNETALLDYMLAKSFPRPFDEIVNPLAQEFRVPAALMYAVIKKESNFKADDISWAGAEGLMQIMPESAKWLNERYSLGVDLKKLRDPGQNLRLGAANLRSMYDQLGADNIRGVIIAHNKGAGNYKKWTARYGSDPVLISELVPNEENEGFIKRVYRYYLINSWLETR
jgi:hypothetical protein